MKRFLRTRAALIMMVVAILGFGLLGCEYFDDVVVPWSDSSAPSLFPSVFRGERHIGWTEPLVFETNDPGEVFFVIASAVDPGGVHEVTLTQSVGVLCRRGGLAQSLHFDMIGMTESVDAEPGDTVSNGLWVGRPVTPGDYANSCHAGWTFSSATYSFGIRAEDFHGNIDTRSGGRITYRP